MRKMISFKIENLPDKERRIVDDWANKQSNIQQSLANLIMHVVEYTGNEDVMDFNIQRKLHTVFTNTETAAIEKTNAAIQQSKTLVTEKIDTSDSGNVYNNAADLFND